MTTIPTSVEFNRVEEETVLDIHLSPYQTSVFELLMKNLELSADILIERLIINEWARQQEQAVRKWELAPND